MARLFGHLSVVVVRPEPVPVLVLVELVLLGRVLVDQKKSCPRHRLYSALVGGNRRNPYYLLTIER